MNDNTDSENRAGDDAGSGLYDYPPELSAGYGIRIAHRLLVRDIDEALGFVGVSRGQWYFLRALWIKDGVTQRELSDRVTMRAPTTVIALRGMEKSNLIYRVREEGDLRKVRVYLTEAGQGLRNILLPMVKMIVDRATAGIPPPELSTFQQVLNRIIKRLHATEDLEPLVWGHPPFEPAPCWKLHPAKPPADSHRPGAPANAASGQSAASHSGELRDFKACAVCYASSRGNPRCPPRAA